MKFKYLSAAIILSLAIFVRFLWLDKVPSSLYYDEIDLGYQVRSLLETGRDYRGSLSPFYFRSFNTDKTPLPILFSAPVSLLFNSHEYQVRTGTALAGVIVVILAMFIVNLLTKSEIATIISGLVFAFSPWLIHFSRLAFEAQFALLFLFLFLYFLFLFQKTKKLWSFYLSAVFLGLTVYTYRTMSLIAPVLTVVTPLFFWSSFKKLGIKQVAIWCSASLFFILPFLYFTTVASKDQPRINQISIFSDSMIPINVQRSRELDSGDFQSGEVGRGATLKSKIFFNKALSYLEKYRDNTFRNFSVDFLFISGDPNGRHSTKNTGELLFVDTLAIILGFVFLFKNISDRKYLFVLVLVILGALPSNLTMDGANHASRLITFAGPLLIVVSFGYCYFFQLLLKSATGRILLALFFGLWVFAAAQFLNKYFFHFPVQNTREFGYGYKQVFEKTAKYEDEYQKIYLTNYNDPPILYYLFWKNISPQSLQEYGTEFDLETNRGQLLDKIKPFRPEYKYCEIKGINSLEPKNLYVVSYESLPLDFRSPDRDPVPAGIKLLDVITYPNNEPAYYIITRDSKDRKTIEPNPNQKCK